jgi:two-component system chemotaxis response regulator CheY
MAKIILVVDDSTTMLASLKATLSMNGYTVATANQGRMALDMLAAGLKPDLIVTDINMPVMGGIELIKNIRTMQMLKFTPILTLTTEGDTEIRNQGKQAGATGWIVKPCSGNNLVAVIRKVLPGA